MSATYGIRKAALLAACLGLSGVAGLAWSQPPAAGPAAPGRAGAPGGPGRGPQPGGVYTGPIIISDGRVAANAAGLANQSTAPEWKRDATLPEDWVYKLAEGVTTRQVSFYVDGGTRLQGTLFLPKGFDPVHKRYPAIVVGHGINAIAVGIEKFAARFADRGFVALAIDYQSYGYSDSGSDELQLLTSDDSTDANLVTARSAPVRVKRTNLNNVHEIDDFRAAISFIQGEPGIDPERIGTWATSNGGIVTSALIGIDGRSKATAIQVMGNQPAPWRPVTLTGPALEDAIKRVKTGQGGETTAGFSFPTNVDAYYTTRNRDVQAGALVPRIRATTPVLFLPAEHDELAAGGNRPALAESAALTAQGVPSQVITLPGLTHFQAYSGPAFEVSAGSSADWYDKFLGAPQPAPAAAHAAAAKPAAAKGSK